MFFNTPIFRPVREYEFQWGAHDVLGASPRIRSKGEFEPEDRSFGSRFAGAIVITSVLHWSRVW